MDRKEFLKFLAGNESSTKLSDTQVDKVGDIYRKGNFYKYKKEK